MKKKISTLILLLSLGWVNAQNIEPKHEILHPTPNGTTIALGDTTVTERDGFTPPPLPPPPPGTPTDMIIYTAVEEESNFPGGFDSLVAFFGANIPDSIPELKDLGIEGQVKVRFCVEQDGKITNVSVVQSFLGCKSCDRAAMEAVKKMPNWIPAKYNDIPVSSWVIIPINFGASER